MRQFASNSRSSGNRSIQTSKFIIYATTNFLLAESEEENVNLLHSLADGVNK